MKRNRTVLKTTSAILSCILLVVTLAACGNSTNYNAGVDLPMVFDIEYTIPDGTKTIISNSQGSYLSAEMYLDFADSEYLSGSVFSANVPVISATAKMIDADSGVQLKIKGAQNDVTAQAKLCGVSSNAALTDFINGDRKIVEGRLFEAVNECIISKDLADYGKLSIGEVITFENTTLDANGNKIIYELTIVGIYSDSTKAYDSWYKVGYLNRRNEILTVMDTVFGVSNDGAGVMMEAEYYLKEESMLKGFEDELREKGLPNDFRVGTKK